MSYTWTTLDPAVYGVPSNVCTKVYDDDSFSFAVELYYHELVRGNRLAGFAPLIGHGSVNMQKRQFALIYSGYKLPAKFPIQPDAVRDVINSILVMARHGYYFVEGVHNSLLWDPDKEQVLLADYRFVDVRHPTVYQPTRSTNGELVRQLLSAGGRWRELSEDDLKELLEQVMREAITETFSVDLDDLEEVPDWTDVSTTRTFLEPPIDIREYTTQLGELITKKFLRSTVHQSMSQGAHVQTPPAPYHNTERFTDFPFIGKMIDDGWRDDGWRDDGWRDDGWRDEVDSALVMRALDPTGRYHARLVVDCETGRHHQLIYEYAGPTLLTVKWSIQPQHRQWFYLGLYNLMEGLQLLHRHQYVHGDVKPDNIATSPFYHLRLIDFGLAARIDRYQVCSTTDEWRYPFHPVELQLLIVDDPATLTNDDLWNEHQRSQPGGIMGEFFRRVSREDKYIRDYWQRLRQLDQTQRCRVITYSTDLYGLGVSLIRATPTWLMNELEPVIYHLITYVYEDRRLELAMAELSRLESTSTDRAV